MKLSERLLKDANIKITPLEKRCLEEILSQGSFFEEDGGNDQDERGFIGYGIDETEVKGCRGALASLVKKGVIQIVDVQDDWPLVFTRYGLTFKEGSYYELDL